jgi:hypothetical protein
MYYHSEEGPWSMYERNKLALKLIIDNLDNKVRMNYESINSLEVNDKLYTRNKYRIDIDRKANKIF